MIVAVLDTNVLVSALCLPRSLPADLLRRPKIVARFAMTEEKAAAFVDVLRELADLVLVTLDLNVVADDPNDNHVIACAVEGEAGYLVSGDHHLTKLVQYQNVSILTPAQFRALLVAMQHGQETPG